MINAELKHLDTLHAQAEQLAAHLLARFNRSGLHSADSQKLKRLSDRACDRAERRYRASIKAWRDAERREKLIFQQSQIDAGDMQTASGIGQGF